jgi:restriction system protein
MPIPDYQSLMLPLLRLAAEGETRVPDVEKPLADMFGLTREERETLLASGRQKVLHNRIHWAKFYMSKAGLIDMPKRGRFIASPEGRSLLARNPDRIDNALLMEYAPFREFYRGGNHSATEEEAGVKTSGKTAENTATPDDRIEAAAKEIQSALSDDVLTRTLQNSPWFFERVVVDLLVKMGYGGSFQDAAARLTPRSGDGGIDGVINEDRLGLDRVYVQAKRYTPGVTVGRPEIQKFVGSLVGEGATKGVFVTTSTFARNAEEFVRHLPQRVILIDGARLTALMIEHNVGVKAHRSIEIKRIDEDYFSEDE